MFSGYTVKVQRSTETFNKDHSPDDGIQFAMVIGGLKAKITEVDLLVTHITLTIVQYFSTTHAQTTMKIYI